MTIYTGKPVEKKDDELESGMLPPEVVEEPLMVNIRVQLVCVSFLTTFLKQLRKRSTMSERGRGCVFVGCCAVDTRLPYTDSSNQLFVVMLSWHIRALVWNPGPPIISPMWLFTRYALT